jgi:hypothetical protein
MSILHLNGLGSTLPIMVLLPPLPIRNLGVVGSGVGIAVHLQLAGVMGERRIMAGVVSLLARIPVALVVPIVLKPLRKAVWMLVVAPRRMVRGETILRIVIPTMSKIISTFPVLVGPEPSGGRGPTLPLPTSLGNFT